MALFAWENAVENPNVTLTATSSVSGFSAEMLRIPLGAPSVAWQTQAGVVSASLLASAASALAFRAVCLARTNLTPAAQIRVQIGPVSAFTEAATLFAMKPVDPTWTLPGTFTVTRAHTPTTATSLYVASDGNYLEVGQNTHRVAHDPATLERLGWLQEPARTNLVRNPRVEGFIAGTPGTTPTSTGWNVTHGGAGINRRVVGYSTLMGMPAIDIEFTCTAVAVDIGFYFADTAAATALSTYTGGSFHQVVSGTPPQMKWYIQTGAANVIGTSFTLSSTPSRDVITAVCPSGGSLMRYNLANANAGYTGVFVLRIAAPQIELGKFETTPIFPPVGTPQASTRGAETFTAPLQTATTSGLVYADRRIDATDTSGTVDQLLMRAPSNAQYSLRLRTTGGSPSSTDLLVIFNGSGQADTAASNVVAGTSRKDVFVWDQNYFKYWAMGALIGTDTGGTSPSVQELWVSAAEAVVYTREIRVYPRLSDTQALDLSSTGSTLTTPTYDSGFVSAGVTLGLRQGLHILSSSISGEAVCISILDPTNPDGYLNIPLVYAGDTYDLDISIATDTGIDFRRNDTVTRGGTTITEALSAARGWQITSDFFGDTELDWLRSLEANAAAGTNILFIPRPLYAKPAAEAVYGLLTPGRRGFTTHDGLIYKWSASISERL